MLKTITLEGLEHPVILMRRKGTRNLRITIRNDGTLRLSVPYGVSEYAAKKFLLGRLEWVKKHLKPRSVIVDNAQIGKSFRLKIIPYSYARPSSRIHSTEVRINLPSQLSITSPSAQEYIKKVCDRALLKEARCLLPQRLEHLSRLHSLPYKSLKVQKLKSRWGACDNHKNITLNCYLVQLEWRLIDYVLCHELAHTIHQHHQKAFWSLAEQLYPNAQAARKELRALPTGVIPATYS